MQIFCEFNSAAILENLWMDISSCDILYYIQLPVDHLRECENNALKLDDGLTF